MTTCGQSRGAQNSGQEELADLIRQTNLETERIILERIWDLSHESTSAVMEFVSEKQAAEMANLKISVQNETAWLRSMVKNATAMVEGTKLDVRRGMAMLGDILRTKFEQNEDMAANISAGLDTLNREESGNRLRMESSRAMMMSQLDLIQDRMTNITEMLEIREHLHSPDLFQTLLRNVTEELERGLSELKQHLLQNITEELEGWKRISNTPCCHTSAETETEGWSDTVTTVY